MTAQTLGGPELFFGLVGAVGTNLENVISILNEELTAVRYRCLPPIRLASLIREVRGYDGLPTAPVDKYIDGHMTAGDDIRHKTGRNDALALMAIGAIQQERKDNGLKLGETLSRRAFMLRSLKHPQEVATLREVYGPSFCLIAAYSSHETRRIHLAKRIAESKNDFPVDRHFSEAEALIRRDQEEIGLPHGQNLRDTFHRADVFLDSSDDEELRRSIHRFIELWFGNTFHTPTKQEFAMFHAKGAALRSAELGRQVGAAIATDEGDIIAVGTNEVPKALGGLYWCNDKPDKREFVEGQDTNETHKRRLFADTVSYLQSAGWLTADLAGKKATELTELAFDPKNPMLPKQSQLRNLIEFGRAVHGEMAALSDAARRGVSVSHRDMYVTTFPCHLCTRHIVAAGIRRVFYIEPYAKSLAAELYPDSIAVETQDFGQQRVLFQPFVGVAPRQYMRLFEMRKRRTDDGQAIPFRPEDANPRYYESERVYLDKEDEKLKTLKDVLNQQGMLF